MSARTDMIEIMAASSLSALFAARLGGNTPSRGADSSALEELLSALLRRAQGAWPEITLMPETFVPYLAERLQQTGDPLDGLSRLRVDDLYLACACGRGDETALALFDSRYKARIDTSLRRVQVPESVAEEVHQLLRKKLFVPKAEAPAEISKYTGRGSLERWVRITAVRMALELSKKARREVSDHDQLLQAVTPDADDPELHYLKTLYRHEFKEAFDEAMASLTSRERVLLKHHLVDRMSIDRIASLQDIHRATAARRLDRIRAGVAQETRKQMMKRLRIARDECDSILRLINSQLDLSISAYLRSVGTR